MVWQLRSFRVELTGVCSCGVVIGVGWFGMNWMPDPRSKSHIFTGVIVSLLTQRMFSGFRSRCAMPGGQRSVPRSVAVSAGVSAGLQGAAGQGSPRQPAGCRPKAHLAAPPPAFVKTQPVCVKTE